MSEGGKNDFWVVKGSESEGIKSLEEDRRGEREAKKGLEANREEESGEDFVREC